MLQLKGKWVTDKTRSADCDRQLVPVFKVLLQRRLSLVFISFSHSSFIYFPIMSHVVAWLVSKFKIVLEIFKNFPGSMFTADEGQGCFGSVIHMYTQQVMCTHAFTCGFTCESIIAILHSQHYPYTDECYILSYGRLVCLPHSHCGRKPILI